MDDFVRLVKLVDSWPDADSVHVRSRLPHSLRIQCLACQRNRRDAECLEAARIFLVDHPLSGMMRPVIWLVAHMLDEQIKKAMEDWSGDMR